MENKKYSARDYHFWKITICLALASFFVFASLYVVQPLLPVFVKTFEVSVSEATLTLSMTIIGLIIGLIILGFLSDRVGRVSLIKYSLVGSVLPFLLIPMTDSFYLIIILRFIQGFLLAGLPAASLAYLNEEIERRSVGIATALYIASNALGGMIGRVAAGYLEDMYSWTTVFYFFTAVGVMICALVVIFLPKSQFFEVNHLPFRKDLEGMAYHWKNPMMLLIIGMGIVLQLSFTSVWTYLPFHLQAEPFSLSTKTISYTFFAYGFGVVGAPLAGWLAGNLGMRNVRIAGILVLSSGILMTLQPSLPVIMIGLCVTCLGFFTAHSLTATTVTEQATHHKGSASSLYLVAYYIGVTLGSSAVSPLWNLAGWNAIIILAGMLPAVYLLVTQLLQKNMEHRGTQMKKR